MPVYVWLSDDEDGSHDWFTADNNEHAIERARRLCLPVFDSMHVESMVFEVWNIDGNQLIGRLRLRL